MFFKISKFFLIVSVLAIALVSVATLFPFIVGKYVWFRTSIDLAFIAFLLGLFFNQRESIQLGIGERLKSLKRNPLFLAVTAFVIAFLLACFFGFDPATSFWSNFERGEGGLQLLHLWLFFSLLIVLFREEKDWRKIFGWSLVTGLLMSIYGSLAAYNVQGFVGAHLADQGFRFQGSIGNPAYVAAYCIFMMFYVLYLLVSKKRFFSFKNILLYVLGLIFLGVFFAAATRGAFLGLVAAILCFLGYFIYAHPAWRKRLFIGFGLIVVLVGLLVGFQNNSFVKSIPGSRIFDISFAADTFATRTIMWQIAFDGWRARPIFGWGPENYIQVFDRHFNVKYFDPTQGFGAWFDRAHSIYFDYLVETGALGILSFLSIFVIFFWQLFKQARLAYQHKANEIFPRRGSGKEGGVDQRSDNPNKSAFVNALMFAVIIAYLVQGIVLFDVLPIYLNVFLVLAFAVYKFESSES